MNFKHDSGFVHKFLRHGIPNLRSKWTGVRQISGSLQFASLLIAFPWSSFTACRFTSLVDPATCYPAWLLRLELICELVKHAFFEVVHVLQKIRQDLLLSNHHSLVKAAMKESTDRSQRQVSEPNSNGGVPTAGFFREVVSSSGWHQTSGRTKKYKKHHCLHDPLALWSLTNIFRETMLTKAVVWAMKNIETRCN